MARWAGEHGVAQFWLEDGKPVRNSFIQSFKGKMRNKCLSDCGLTRRTKARRLRDASRWACHAMIGHIRAQRPKSPRWQSRTTVFFQRRIVCAFPCDEQREENLEGWETAGG
jgi:hypothetical protein